MESEPELLLLLEVEASSNLEVNWGLLVPLMDSVLPY